MATWAQVQTAVINQTDAGNIPWRRLQIEDRPTLYLAEHKGFTVLVFADKVKIKYREISRIKQADMSKLRTAIENYLADTGEAAALNAIYALLNV